MSQLQAPRGGPGAPPPPSNIGDIFFPSSGIDVSVALEAQTPNTCPSGTNVRAFEPLTQRMRGGSRSGLSKYINAQASGVSPIQMLGVIVDPQAIALGISFDDSVSPSPFIDDPSNLGRNILGDGSIGWITLGGSGFHTSNTYKRKHPKGALLVQNGNFVFQPPPSMPRFPGFWGQM